MGFLFDVNSSTSFFVADSENPAEKEDPTFKLAKVHSASTVISNLSLISASIESDLDSKVGGSQSKGKIESDLRVILAKSCLSNNSGSIPSEGLEISILMSTVLYV